MYKFAVIISVQQFLLNLLQQLVCSFNVTPSHKEKKMEINIAKTGGSNADSKRRKSGDDDEDISRSAKKEKIESPLIAPGNPEDKNKEQDGGALRSDPCSRDAAHFLSIFPEEV